MEVFMQLNEVKTCRHGQMIYNKHDKYIGRSLDLYGEYSESEVILFKQLILKGMCVLDVGANMGSHTLAFSRFVGEDGMVCAFEPQRLIFQMLAGTMAINSIKNVYCYQKAVGEKQGFLKVPYIDYEKVTNWGSVPLGEWTEGESVEVVAIDDMNLPWYHFLKIDVEGMELAVLKGAQETIRKFRPYLYVENDREEKTKDLIIYIDSLGYDMYWHYPALFNPHNYALEQKNIFENIVSINMLCLPREFDIKITGFEKVVV